MYTSFLEHLLHKHKWLHGCIMTLATFVQQTIHLWSLVSISSGSRSSGARYHSWSSSSLVVVGGGGGGFTLPAAPTRTWFTTGMRQSSGGGPGLGLGDRHPSLSSPILLVAPLSSSSLSWSWSLSLWWSWSWPLGDGDCTSRTWPLTIISSYSIQNSWSCVVHTLHLHLTPYV